jgi:predicted acyl esterase
MLHLPPPRSEYKLTRGIAIPARDGIMLAADLYQPARTARGTLLVRGPYGRAMPFSLLTARIFAIYGYNVLLVSSRGTFGSGGEFDPARTEAADGQDVVAWLVRQSWFTGSFATLGGSYLGYTQWAVLADPPAELVTAIITVGPHDLSRHTWGTGAFNLDLLGWSDMIAHQEDGGAVSGLFRRAIAARRLRPVLDGLPVADVADKHLDDRPAPDRDDAQVRLELRPTADRFAAGSRLRLYIAGGSHPQFARNLGTGENPGTGAGLRPATHSIAHAGETASSVTLPASPP